MSCQPFEESKEQRRLALSNSRIFVEVLEEPRSCDARLASSEDARTFFRALSRGHCLKFFRAAHADRPEKHKK